MYYLISRLACNISYLRHKVQRCITSAICIASRMQGTAFHDKVSIKISQHGNKRTRSIFQIYLSKITDRFSTPQVHNWIIYNTVCRIW